MDEKATLLATKAFFGISSMSQFRKEWEQLTEDEKNAIRGGIGNGSLTY